MFLILINLTQITCPDVPVMGDLNNPTLFGSRTFRGMFSSCAALERINNIADWPINGRISASGFMFMFEGCSNLRYGDLGTGIINLSGWDVGNNVNYMRMFNGCTLFNGWKAFQKAVDCVGSASGGSTSEDLLKVTQRIQT